MCVCVCVYVSVQMLSGLYTNTCICTDTIEVLQFDLYWIMEGKFVRHLVFEYCVQVQS